MSIRLFNPSGGFIDLNAGGDGTAANVFTLPAETGTIVTTGSTASVSQSMLSTNTGLGGPSFLVSMGSVQTFTGSTNTKVNYDTESFDSNGNYNTSDKRFTPTVAGYYFIGATMIVDAVSDANYEQILRIYKNGSVAYWSNNNQNATGHFNGFTASGMVFLNGSSDYVEGYYFSSVQTIASKSASQCIFYGFLVRAT